jgi:hypothetical protein
MDSTMALLQRDDTDTPNGAQTLLTLLRNNPFLSAVCIGVDR